MMFFASTPVVPDCWLLKNLSFHQQQRQEEEELACLLFLSILACRSTTEWTVSRVLSASRSDRAGVFLNILTAGSQPQQSDGGGDVTRGANVYVRPRLCSSKVNTAANRRMSTMRRPSILAFTLFAAAEAFSPHLIPTSTPTFQRSLACWSKSKAERESRCKSLKTLYAPERQLQTALATTALIVTLVTATFSHPLPSVAYDPSDFASETVTQVVESLNSAAGDADKTFEAYENIATVITEGKGVGGSINYGKSSMTSEPQEW